MSEQRLFIIKHANGTGTILQAGNEAEALEAAGFNATATLPLAEREMFSRMGIDKAPSAILRLENFMVNLRVAANGDFVLELESDECAEELGRVFPVVAGA